MVIHIHPSRIHLTPGGTHKAAERRAQQQDHPDHAHTAPRRVDENFVPAPESLATLIQSAVAALRRGVYWDRGTIVNLRV